MRPPSKPRVSAVGSSRRLQALATLGWSVTALAPMLQATKGQLDAIRYGHTERVTVDLAERISVLYENLRYQAGPDERVATKCAPRWPGPGDWVDIDDPNEKPPEKLPPDPVPDEVAVQRFLAGRDVPLNRADKAEVLRVGALRGLNMTVLMGRLGVSWSTAKKLMEAA